MFELSSQDSIAILKWDHGKVHAADREFLQGLLAQLNTIEKSTDNALVITGSRGSFCAGANLKKMLEGRNYIEPFMRELNATILKIFSFPKPTVAAINGHAIAAGYFMAAACDYRVLLDNNAKIGAPEKKLGMLFPAIMRELIQLHIHREAQDKLIERSELVDPVEALQLKMVDELADDDNLLNQALAKAKDLSLIKGFVIKKMGERRAIIDKVQTMTKHEIKVVEKLCSDETQNLVREFSKR